MASYGDLVEQTRRLAEAVEALRGSVERAHGGTDGELTEDAVQAIAEALKRELPSVVGAPLSKVVQALALSLAMLSGPGQINQANIPAFQGVQVVPALRPPQSPLLPPFPTSPLNQTLIAVPPPYAAETLFNAPIAADHIPTTQEVALLDTSLKTVQDEALAHEGEPNVQAAEQEALSGRVGKMTEQVAASISRIERVKKAMEIIATAAQTKSLVDYMRGKYRAHQAPPPAEEPEEPFVDAVEQQTLDAGAQTEPPTAQEAGAQTDPLLPPSVQVADTQTPSVPQTKTTDAETDPMTPSSDSSSSVWSESSGSPRLPPATPVSPDGTLRAEQLFDLAAQQGNEGAAHPLPLTPPEASSQPEPVTPPSLRTLMERHAEAVCKDVPAFVSKVEAELPEALRSVAVKKLKAAADAACEELDKRALGDAVEHARRLRETVQRLARSVNGVTV